MDKEMFLELYLHLVRPLEYAVQVWSPKLLKDVDKLEKVQRRATKLVPEISDLPYETRLQILGLPSLKERRIRGDMIEVFKISTFNVSEDYCWLEFPMFIVPKA